MDNLLIPAKVDTPYVCFDELTGVFEISGKSLPEDSVRFYRPVLTWVEEYMRSPRDITTLNLKFVYINTSSSKMVIEIISLFVKNKQPRKELRINWHYKKDDDEQREEGEEYSDLVKYPFNLVEYIKF
jgi:hypothetical protein